MADYSLGKAEGQIKVTYDGKGIGQARDDLGRFVKGSGGGGGGSSLANAEEGLRSVAQTAGIAGAAIAAGIGFAVNAAIDFEKQLSAIGAVSGATAGQMDELRKKALQLGADTSFSASEAAIAMEELVKAGLSVEDVLNGAADATVALAAAGQIALPEAAAIASNAMNQFKLSAQDLPRIADLIAGAANSSAIDISDFGFSMSQAGAIANLVGVSFEDLATAIALMGNQGIKGSDAGTSLKTMLSNLQPTTKKQIDLMKELGIVTENGSNKFFDQQGKLKSLSDVAGILNTSLKGMTKAQQLMALETIFGSDAIRAAAIIAGEGAEGFNKLSEQIKGVSAADVAAKRLDNVAGAIDQLKGSVETAAIVFGSALLPVVKKVTQFITELVNRFTALDPKWQKLIAFAAVAAAGLLLLIAALAAVGAAIAGVAASLVAIKIAAIIGAIVIAIAAIATAIKLAYDRSAEFRDLMAKFGTVAKAAFENFLVVARPIAAFVKNELIPAIKRIVETLINNLQPAFAAVGDFIKNKILPAFESIKGSLEGAMPTIITVAKFLLQMAEVSFMILGKVLGFIIPLLLQLAGPIFGVLITTIKFIIDLIPFLADAFKLAVAVAKTNIDLLVGIVMWAWDTIKAIWNKIWEWVVAPTINGFRAVVEAVRSFMQAVQDKVKQALESVAANFISARDKVIAAVNGFVAIVNKVRDFFTQMKDAAIAKANELVAWVGGLAGKLVGAVGNLGSALYGAGRSLIQGFWNGMQDIWNSMLGWVQGKMSTLRGLWPGSPAKWGPFSGRGYTLYAGRSLMEAFADGMNQRVGMVSTAAEQALAAVAGKLPTDFSASVGAATAGVAVTSAGSGHAAAVPSSGTVINNEIHLHVDLDDLNTVKDIEELLAWVDKRRNDSRRGLVGVS